MKIPILYSPRFGDLDFGRGHPFKGSRFADFMGLLHERGIDRDERFLVVEPPSASDSDLELVHVPEYVERVHELEQSSGYLSADTQVTPGLPEVAKLLTGASMHAGRFVAQGDAEVAVAFGGFHHAGRDYGEGFCVWNDVAITAEMLIRFYGAKRVLIIDTDAHQGNGTMDIFYDRSDVLFISLHQDPKTLYPGKGFIEDAGEGEGAGFTVNACMPPFSSDGQYRHVMEEIFVPLAREYKPDVIIRNGGSDPFFGDELTNLGLTLEGLRMVNGIVRETSDSSCKKLVDLMCSGYGKHVAEGWLALFYGTTGIDYTLPDTGLSPPKKAIKDLGVDYETKKMVKRLKEIHSEHWDSLR